MSNSSSQELFFSALVDLNQLMILGQATAQPDDILVKAPLLEQGYI